LNAWHPQWIVPEWSAPDAVRALITTRAGGTSAAPFDASGGGGMNLGFGSGDDLAAVAANRARLRAALPAMPGWLKQIHGARAVDAAEAASASSPLEADAAFTDRPGVVAVAMMADCLPVLLADARGRGVAVAHAGWRGLVAGVIQASVRALRERVGDPSAGLIAYLGPAIGPDHFEVGPEVRDAACNSLAGAESFFVPHGSGKYRADLFALGRLALAQEGVDAVFGGGVCTYCDADRFYSHRRDRVTGRHAALIWLEA
jgi:polyphenol oxidase